MVLYCSVLCRGGQDSVTYSTVHVYSCSTVQYCMYDYSSSHAVSCSLSLLVQCSVVYCWGLSLENRERFAGYWALLEVNCTYESHFLDHCEFTSCNSPSNQQINLFSIHGYYMIEK